MVHFYVWVTFSLEAFDNRGGTHRRILVCTGACLALGVPVLCYGQLGPGPVQVLGAGTWEQRRTAKCVAVQIGDGFLCRTRSNVARKARGKQRDTSK